MLVIAIVLCSFIQFLEAYSQPIRFSSIVRRKEHAFQRSMLVSSTTRLMVAEITEFGEEELPEEATILKPKTHGYEGDFQVGDIVRVTKPIRIWSVKQYSAQGFECQGFVGTVSALVLYGRKYGSLCSAITPVKVEFLPDGEGVPKNMFEKKWVAHFSAAELELLVRPTT